MKSLLAILAICALFTLPAYAQDQSGTDTENAAETGAENGAEAEEANGEEAQENGEETVSSEEADEAAEVISGIAEDKAKADGYCAIFKEMEAAPEGDEAKATELSTKMEEYIKGLGDDAVSAFATADSIDAESEDGQKVQEALEELNEKCGA